jgi:hypothetical protein
MPRKSLEELLELMPEIADAVNAFNSEAVQQQVFILLTEDFQSEAEGQDEPPGDETTAQDNGSKPGTKRATQNVGGARTSQRATRTRSAQQTSAPKIVANLNLRPKDTQSLRDFIAEERLYCREIT